jgi:uncharacterized GH25 family protein
MPHITPDADTLKGLIGSDLSGFHIVEMVEVYAKNADGLRTETIKIFSDEAVAQVFMDNGKDIDYKGMRKILVLTNGEIAFTFENVKRVAIFNEGDMRILREDV